MHRMQTNFVHIYYKDDKTLLLCKETLIYVILPFAHMTFDVSEGSKLRLKVAKYFAF